MFAKTDGQNTDYTINQKMMIVSLAIFFIALVFVMLFYVYLRFFENPTRRHILHPITAAISPKGLPVRVLNSIPTFNYDSKSRESPMECAVCLSEFEEDEKGRILPDCKHCFHIDCIDMWLHSHRDCPLCRAEVKFHQAVKNPGEVIEKPLEIVITIPELVESGLEMDSGLNPTSESDENRMAGCPPSATTISEVPTMGQQIGPMGQDPTQSESIPDCNPNLGLRPDIESGLKPVSSGRVLKRLFSM